MIIKKDDDALISAKDAFSELELGSLSIAHMLKSYRLGEELSQVDFSRSLGISKQDLANIEAGRTKVSLKRALEFADKINYPRAAMARIWVEEILVMEGIDPIDIMGKTA